MISADTERQGALGYALDWGRGAGKRIQIGAPTLEKAMEFYLARTKLRSEVHRSGVRQQFELHLEDWLRLPLDEINKSTIDKYHRAMAASHLWK